MNARLQPAIGKYENIKINQKRTYNDEHKINESHNPYLIFRVWTS